LNALGMRTRATKNKSEDWQNAAEYQYRSHDGFLSNFIHRASSWFDNVRHH
jgi:hypothetical protein